MQFRRFRLRLRRSLRHSQHQVEDMGAIAEAGLERHFFRRLGSLGKAWRFITVWVLLLVLLIGGTIAQNNGLSHYYQTSQPMPGGIYSEGIVGTFTNANPIYAVSAADVTVARLVFAGLLTYDDDNQLKGDLAQSWDVDTAGTLYTVHLRPHLTWQDGTALTADDVVFTYRAIQNPDAQSPLAGSWQGITVAKKDANTVTFKLSNPLAAFPYSLTTGIIPSKAFKNLPPASWRSADFNSLHPIGAGPFAWNALQVKNNSDRDKQILIALKPFGGYIHGKPKLNSFVVHTFTDQKVMRSTFASNQLSAIADSDSTPTNNSDVETHSFTLTAANMAFFNTASNILSDVQVRRALVQGTNVAKVQRALSYPTRSVREPLLKGQVGYDASLQQAKYDLVAAKGALDKAGWLTRNDGMRYKDNKPLQLKMVATDSHEHQLVSRAIQRAWRELGVKLDAPLETDQDFQNTFASRNYDVVLYGISIGVDPDVYVYWHSSQTDPRSTRLNLSQYKSGTADIALEAGRTRLDPVLRAVKYKPFLQAWQQDAPALGLYQPQYHYLSHEHIYGLDSAVINNPVDRLNNVQNWMVLTHEVTNQ